MKTPTIYDSFGRPIKKTMLIKEQAETTISGIRSYFNFHTAIEFTPQKLANYMKAAASGDLFAHAALCENMEERDTHIFAEFSKRKRTISSISYEILPFDDSAKAVDIAEFISNMLQNITFTGFNLDQAIGFDNVIFNIADAIGKALSINEIIYDISENQYIVKQIKFRPIDWFQFNPHNATELRLRDNSFEGEELIPGKWIVHYHPAKSGSPYRAALFRVLAWLFLFRNFSVKSWWQFLEVFGMPLRLGKFPEGTSDDEKDALLKAVVNIAQDAAAIIPEGMDVEFKDAVRGSGNPHQKMLEWTEKEISKAILGATLTSNNQQVGSYSLGQVHNQVRMDILQSDITFITATVSNQLIKPVVQLNYGKDAPLPYIQFDIPKPDQRETFANILEKLASIGMTDIPIWWIRENLNIPAPQKDDITLADIINQSTQGIKTTNKKKNINQKSDNEFTPNQKTIEALIKNSLRIIGSSHIDTLLEVVKNSKSYEDLAENIVKAFPDIDIEQFEEILSDAMFTAEIFGHANYDKS